MKENKISRRSFLKFGAAASAAGMMAAAPVAAHAAQADASAAADEENCLLDVFKEMYLLHIPMETLSELFESYKKERMKSQE